MTPTATVFSKPSMQFFLIMALCLVSTILFSIIAGLAVLFFYQLDLSSIYDYTNPATIEGLKLFQLISAIGLFIVPPLIYSVITSKNVFKSLSLHQLSKPTSWLLVTLIMMVASPLMAWVVEVNEQMSLPEFMAPIEQWMKQSELSAQELTKAFLTFNGVGSLLYILIIVAVVPAIGEELLFRGVLQKIVINWIHNKHWGIWITAILFSALHMQFYGFFPRMLLGVLFGYLLVWSGSLWLPILGHFINNGSVVVLSYFYPEMMEAAEINLFGEGSSSWLVIVISALLVAGGVMLFRKLNMQGVQAHE